MTGRHVTPKSDAPRVIKRPLPGEAVEKYLVSHHGFLPTEELTWIDSFITAMRANLIDKCRDVEFEELKKLAIAGSYAIGQNADRTPQSESAPIDRDAIIEQCAKVIEPANNQLLMAATKVIRALKGKP